MPAALRCTRPADVNCIARPSYGRATRHPPLPPHQRAFCTEQTLRRYLIARKSDKAKALAMLEATLAWREAFGVDRLSAAAVRPNGETGKVFVCGPDRAGQPVLVLRPGRENTKDDHDGNLKHLVYQLERAVGCMDEDRGVSKMTVILDLHNYSSSNSPPMRTSRATLDILQNHYPERLSRFVILHAPWLFYAFFKVISPFIDKVTAEKILFVRDDPKVPGHASSIVGDIVPLDRIPGSLVQPTAGAASKDDTVCCLVSLAWCSPLRGAYARVRVLF